MTQYPSSEAIAIAHRRTKEREERMKLSLGRDLTHDEYTRLWEQEIDRERPKMSLWWLAIWIVIGIAAWVFLMALGYGFTELLGMRPG